MTEVKHSFGRKGFYTDFTVASGGKISDPDNPSTVATKYVNRMGGANRQRRMIDYILQGEKHFPARATPARQVAQAHRVRRAQTELTAHRRMMFGCLWATMARSKISLIRLVPPLFRLAQYSSGRLARLRAIGCCVTVKRLSRTAYADLFGL